MSPFPPALQQGKGTMTTYWLEGQWDAAIPVTPGGLSLSDFNPLNIHEPESEKDGQSDVTSETDEEPEDGDPSPKYLSFLNMPSLPNAADIISNDSGLLELFDSDFEESDGLSSTTRHVPWTSVLFSQEYRISLFLYCTLQCDIFKWYGYWWTLRTWLLIFHLLSFLYYISFETCDPLMDKRFCFAKIYEKVIFCLCRHLHLFVLWLCEIWKLDKNIVLTLLASMKV